MSSARNLVCMDLLAAEVAGRITQAEMHLAELHDLRRRVDDLRETVVADHLKIETFAQRERIDTHGLVHRVFEDGHKARRAS